MAASRTRSREALRGSSSPAAEEPEMARVRPHCPALLDQTWTLTGWAIAQAIRTPAFKNHITTGGGDVPMEWPGLPIGTRFSPTDDELLQHLKEKIGQTNSMSHPFIDAFIPTLEEPEGIYSTHPKNLPGIRMDGRAHYFFHKIPNGNGTVRRTRRKISNGSDYWWHQTGKALQKLGDDGNGVTLGWKKVFVLKKASSNAGWTMHQYHLGADRRKEGELVLSKIFYSGLPPKPSSPPLPSNNLIMHDHQEVQVLHEEITTVPQDPEEPAAPVGWWWPPTYMDVGVLPVPAGLSSHHLDGHLLPLTGTGDLGNNDQLEEVQLGSREGLESLLDCMRGEQEP